MSSLGQDERLAVYKGKFNLPMQDPDMPQPRFHTVIWVELEPATRAGRRYHVTGDITSGMVFESRSEVNPELDENFHSQEFIGYRRVPQDLDEFETLLKDIPAPAKQKAFNMKTMRTEPVKDWNPLTFYEPGEARRPLVKCTEWTEQQAIPALFASGLLFSQS